MDIIVGPVTSVCEIVGPTFLRQCGYIVSCNSHANSLEREIKNLRDASDRLHHEVDLAESVGDIIEHDVWTWLTDAEKLIKSKNLILEKRVVRCCFGFVPNPRTRYVLGRRAKKSLPDLRALIERGKFDGVSFHPPVELVPELKVRSATSSSTARYVNLKSRALVLKRIMAALNENNKVGVYGMGGVGKTTLLKDVEKRARESGKFDDVVTVFVSQAPSIESIKSKILNKLGSLGSNGDDANEKTLLILLDDLWSKLKGVDALENGCKVNVKWVMTSRNIELLANGMECYPTISLGILEEEEGWDFFAVLVNNSKVEELKNNTAVVALLKKCAGLPVSIEALATVLEKKGLSSSDLVMEDVLKLGKETINGSASLELSYNYLGDTDMANLARSLFRIIGLLGTPTVLILTLLKYTIGLGLLGSSSSSDSNIMERARRQVSTSLRMLQDASLLLESDDNDYVKIHDVVRDVAANIASRDDHALIFDSEDGLKGWSKDDIPKLNEEAGAALGLGLLGTNSSNKNIMERARRHVVKSSLRMLQDASLLLGSDDRDFVKIHDVVRDFAASFASRDDHALVFECDDDGLIRGWSKEKLKKSKSVYLPYSVIPKLDEGWECPELNIFIMEAEAGDHVSSFQKEGRGHVKLPSSFYKGMAKLKVLDFRNAWLSSLPFSTQSDLRNITTLFLHFCCIENVSVIAKLGSLQILSFVGSDLAHLPKEIGDLTKLRMLDLSQCSDLKTIEPGTLKRLTRLEELYIKESFDGWEVEGAEKQSNSSLAELNCLPRLKSLEVYVPNTDTLPTSLPLGDLVRYKVLIGDSWNWSGEYRESRILKFKEKSKNMLNEDWIQSALHTTQDLCLDGLSEAGGSFHEQCKEKFKELKQLHLQNSPLIEYIIWSTEWLDCNAFTTLESMVLNKMQSLEKICDGRINPSSFSKLKVVRVQECHKLSSLFNLSMLENLRELAEIEITDCKMLKQIVIAEQLDDDANVEEQQNVATSGCSNIFFGRPTKRPMKGAENGGADGKIKKLLGNLRYLTLRNLPEITSFFNEPMVTSLAPVFFNDDPKESHPPKYKEIQPTTRLGLDQLQRVELTDCKNVVHFTNFQVLVKLVNLESLTITGCESLEDIFDLEGIELGSGNFEILPKLYELKLRGLPKLEQVWKKNPKQKVKGCRKLRTLEIYNCDNLLYFCSSFMCEVMENLTEINLGYCRNMYSLFLEEGLESNASSIKVSLTSLKTLAISKCPNLKAFILDNCQTISNSTASRLNFDSSEDIKKGMAYWCYGKKGVDTSNFVDTSTNSFFNQKVLLSNLERLILDTAGKFEKLWCGEIPDQSYCKLEYLHVDSCQNLLAVIPASLINRLHNLKQIWVSYCKKLEVVFDDDVGWKTKTKSKVLMLPQLQEVKLQYLHSLRHVMERSCDDEIVVGFPILNRFEVHSCNKLINLITTTTATTLLELKSLDINLCPEMLEVISGEVSERYKRNTITFPHLTSMSLLNLESLTCFTSESHRFDFPCLKILKIFKCKSLKKLTMPRLDGRMGSQDEDQANATCTEFLFNEKIQLPNLEELHISNSGVLEELWNEPPTSGSFCKLKGLEIYDCPCLQSVIPSFMVNRLQNIERIRILRCDSLQDIFKTTSSTKQIHSSHDSKIVEERIAGESILESRQTHERIIMKTSFLKLEGSNIQLNNLWSGSYILEMPLLKKLVLNRINKKAVEAIMEKVHLPSLEELVVFSSGEITEVWHTEPPVGSFNKLQRLQVEKCGGLVKIIPFFMLKRLQNLEKLVVKNCNNLEIVCELKCLIDVQDSESRLPCIPFQMLASISVEKCDCLRSLFSISEQQTEYGEKTYCDKIVRLPQLTYLRLVDLPKFSHLLFQQVLQAGQYTLELSSLKEFSLIEAGDEAITHKVKFPEKLEIQESDESSNNFFGSITSVVTDIIKALQQTNQVVITGLLGDMGIEMQRELKQQVVKKEATNLFDKVVECRETKPFYIQEEIGRALGIVYGETEVQGRAERLRKSLLTYIRNRRLLLVMRGVEDEAAGITPLEAVGIPPLDRVDPKHFKIILVSQEKELLLKMGAKLPIFPIGRNVGNRWSIFRVELEDISQAFPTLLQQEEEGELPSFDTNTDICSFVGPNTNLFNNIIKALLNCQNQIIGVLGSTSYLCELLLEANRLLKSLFDESIKLEDNEVDTIQKKLETSLGISETTGLRHENKAQCIRQSLLSSSSNQERRRLLLILYDLDQEVDLEAVGIPLDKLDPKFFKILLMSNKKQVLQKMGAQQVFERGIEPLKSPWFWRILDGYMGNSEFKKLREECGSDDLARLLAKKLKDQGMHAWANAFQRLRESPFEYEERRKVIASL